jgi:hypothetical protein
LRWRLHYRRKLENNRKFLANASVELTAGGKAKDDFEVTGFFGFLIIGVIWGKQMAAKAVPLAELES